MLSINAQTKLCLLLGNPVSHSLSPLLHNTAYKAMGLNYAYLAVKVDQERVAEAVSGLRALSVAGANVTSPHKEAVIPYLDSITEEAKSIKSVNTIVNRDGHLHGSSTDGAGFFQALKQAAPDYDIKQPVLLVGAGGAARAVAYTMAGSGISELLIANRSMDKARDLAALIRNKTKLTLCSAIALDDPALAEELPRFRLVIYTLPTDLDQFIALLCKSGMPFNKSICVDLRYSPPQSAIMQQFRKLGGHAFNGLGMLLWQAIVSFEQITGRKAPVLEMQKSIKSS